MLAAALALGPGLDKWRPAVETQQCEASVRDPVQPEVKASWGCPESHEGFLGLFKGLLDIGTNEREDRIRSSHFE